MSWDRNRRKEEQAQAGESDASGCPAGKTRFGCGNRPLSGGARWRLGQMRLGGWSRASLELRGPFGRHVGCGVKKKEAECLRS
jgi:hypothetical protein